MLSNLDSVIKSFSQLLFIPQAIFVKEIINRGRS